MFSILISFWGYRNDSGRRLTRRRPQQTADRARCQAGAPHRVAAHPARGYTAAMSRLVIAIGLALLAGSTPAAGWAQSIMSPAGSETVRRPPHRPRRPVHPPIHKPIPVIPCCLGFSYYRPPDPPVIVPGPPPVIYVVPSSPTLTYVAPARPEPAPEVLLPTGRWERHGNGKEYPYTWVWVGAAPAR